VKIVLLTHDRELTKASNTGRLVRDVLRDQCELLVWQRKEPDKTLVDLLESKQAVLLFPESELPTATVDGSSPTFKLSSEYLARESNYRYFVILDATWQQAKKMYRQSTYLQAADKLILDNAAESRFARRRNQREGGLCTAECAMEILMMLGCDDLASRLEKSYLAFNSSG
jgi:DTW domain-containing protein YfiP